MQGEGTLGLGFSERAELVFDPAKQLPQRLSGLISQWPVLLAELCAKASDGTSGARQVFATVRCHSDKSLEPVLWGGLQVPLHAHLLELGAALGDDGLADRRFGLEVVVDVAERNRSVLGDISQRDLAEAAGITQFRRRLDQTAPFVPAVRTHR